jgi:hypothetical protein
MFVIAKVLSLPFRALDFKHARVLRQLLVVIYPDQELRNLCWREEGS